MAHTADVARVGRAARELARATGFDEIAADELRLVAHELAGNIVRHAACGEVTLVHLHRREGCRERQGVELRAFDRGPGIADTDQALCDGFSTAGGPGCGLGAAERLSDELRVVSPTEHGDGVRVVCRRWSAPAPDPAARSLLSVGACTRSRNGETVNGDAYFVHSRGPRTLVGVIDGIGHGPAAHAAAQAALDFLRGRADGPLPALFTGVARRCRTTRGVVMALARVDESRRRLRFASVGNIEGRTEPGGPSRRFVVRRGILGGRAPAPVVSEHPWSATGVLVLHSDGLSSRWRWEKFAGLWGRPADDIARGLLRELADGTDDATVVVVRGRSPAKDAHQDKESR